MLEQSENTNKDRQHKHTIFMISYYTMTDRKGLKRNGRYNPHKCGLFNRHDVSPEREVTT